MEFGEKYWEKYIDDVMLGVDDLLLSMEAAMSGYPFPTPPEDHHVRFTVAEKTEPVFMEILSHYYPEKWIIPLGSRGGFFDHNEWEAIDETTKDIEKLASRFFSSIDTIYTHIEKWQPRCPWGIEIRYNEEYFYPEYLCIYYPNGEPRMILEVSGFQIDKPLPAIIFDQDAFSRNKAAWEALGIEDHILRTSYLGPITVPALFDYISRSIYVYTDPSFILHEGFAPQHFYMEVRYNEQYFYPEAVYFGGFTLNKVLYPRERFVALTVIKVKDFKITK
jgi:hypothetical protein